MKKFGFLFVPLLTAGMLCAQTPAASQPAPANNQTQQQSKARHNRRPMLSKLTSDLNLTADQQTKAKGIFQKSWQDSKALRPKLREERSALLSAVKSGDQARIDQVIQQNTQLNAQRAEIHAKAMARFYSILNPDQKTKMDQKMNASFMRPMMHRGHRAQPSGAGER